MLFKGYGEGNRIRRIRAAEAGSDDRAAAEPAPHSEEIVMSPFKHRSSETEPMEEWEPWETRLVVWSLLTAVAALAMLAWMAELYL